MIIECPNCNKKFNLDEKLIPENGRTLKCNGCEHIWHYKISPNINIENENTKLDINIPQIDKKKHKKKEESNNKEISDIDEEILPEETIKDEEIEVKNANNEKEIKIKIIFIYFIVLIISLLGLIFLLDTFKNHLSNLMPGLIPFLDSLYETLLDLKLFFKDLTN